MRKIVPALATLVMLANAASPAAAQDAMKKDEGFFGKPAFVLMPSVVIAPVFSGIGSGDKGPTRAAFNARFMTVVPTKFEYFQLVAGAQFEPNGTHGPSYRFNQPTLFYGGIIPLAFLTKATNGFFSLSVDPLGVYALGGGNSDRDLYGHEFVLEGALVANVGQKMFTNMGFFSSTSVFFLLDQQLTHTRFFDDNGAEQHDYWHPAIVTGIVIPVGR